MKRLISFIMTLTITCGLFMNPYLTMEVEASSDWGSYNDSTYTWSVTHSSFTEYAEESSIDPWTTPLSGDDADCSQFLNNYVDFLNKTTASDSLIFSDDNERNPSYVIRNRLGDDVISNSIVLYYHENHLYNSGGWQLFDMNEIAIWLEFCIIDLNTLKPYVINVYHRSKSELTKKSMSSIKITEDEYKPVNASEPGEYGNLRLGSLDDVSLVKIDIETLWDKTYNSSDFMSNYMNLNANSPDDLTGILNELIYLEAPESDMINGKSVNVEVQPNSEYVRGDSFNADIHVATIDTDVYGATDNEDENEGKCTPAEAVGTFSLLTEAYNTFIASSKDKAVLLEKAESASDENIWNYIRALANCKQDTNIIDNTDPLDGTQELPILTDFKVLEHALRCSLKMATTDTSNKPYVHTMKIISPSSSVEYEIDFAASPNGERTVIKEVRKNGNKYDLLNTVTAYQYDSLKITYKYIYSNSNITNPKAIIQTFASDDTVYKVSNGSKLTDNIVSEETMRDAIEEFETYTFNRSAQGVIDTARLASVLMKYTLYHSTNTNFKLFHGEDTDGDNEADTMTDATHNDILYGLLDDWNVFNQFNDDVFDKDGDGTYDDGKSFAFVDMPGSVGALGNKYDNLIRDSINGDFGFQAIVRILYAQSYVFEALNSSAFGIDNKFDPASISAIMKDPHATTEAEYNGLGDVIEWLKSCHDGSQWQAELAAKSNLQLSEDSNIWIFRSIIELYDVITLLDIDPKQWSPTIDAYYQLYVDNSAAFEVLRNSPLLYGTGYTGGATTENPLGVFYSVQGREMSEKWNIGFSNSALYVPMVTNLYNAGIYEFANTKDSEWISEFMYKYGFHRKALYISTDPNVIVNNKMNKSSDNGMVVARLKDLLNYERDIQLYIDTSFYNAKEIEDAIGKVDYATLYQYMHDKDITVNVTDEAALENLKDSNSGANMTFYNDDANNFIDETLNLDAKTLLKDEDIASYSVDVAKNVTHLGETAMESESLYDGYVLSADALTGEDNIFSLYNYTPMLSYAVVSAIYRDVDIYNELSAVSKSTRTVFQSSKNILYADGTTNHDWISYMNYLQLANLEKQMNVNVETQLDLNSPIFIDIFGNIVTESGFVIIPAASNATLCGDNWTPYTIGFGTYMAAGGCDILTEDLPDDVFEWLTAMNIESMNSDTDESAEAETLNLDNLGAGTKGGWFVYTRDGELQLKNVYLQSYGLSAAVNWSTLNANSDVIQEVFWNNAFFAKSIKMYNSRTINMVTEVLRGAPIENIDYYEEGIKGEKSGEAGIVLAYALDELLNTLSSDNSDFVNSMTTMPNVAFMPYLKYVVYFAIKITLAIFILAFVIRLFMAGVKDRLGIKEVIKLAFTIIIVASAVYILPNTITWSYDKANSTMLTDETEEILLYSAMRNAEGQQIGITEVSKIDENTQLLVQVDKVNPQWSKILGNALLSNEYNSFTDLFEDSLKDTPYYNMAGVVQKGTNVYIDINTIMDSTRIAYNGTTNTLYNKNVIRSNQQYYSQKAVYKGDQLQGFKEGVTSTGNVGAVDNPTADGDGYIKQDYYAVYSFTSPYYVILDQLIANINEYNQQHNVQTYTATIDSKGKVMTYDVAAPYLLSDEFMVEGYDILGLTDALMCERQLPKFAYIFDEDDKMNMKQSAWYPNELDEETKQERIANVYNYARAFIVDHRDVIKHIPDEMLIKVLAFACSVKFNQEFHCPYGGSVALITVDNRDLMRFMLSDFEGVYSNVAYSFGRFVYQTSGTVGVILAAILCAITLLTTVIKPLLIWILFVLIIVNILFREILFDKPNQGVEGYFIGCALFMCVNFIYSGCLKICFIVADSDLSAVAAMLLCILVQVLYLVAMAWLVWTQVSDWKRSGYSHYENGVNMVGGMFYRAPSGRRRLDGRRTHAPGYYDYGRQNYGDVRLHPSDEPQGVYVTDRPRRVRGNRRTYNGPVSLEEMRQRDEERESSPFRR